MNNKSSIIAVLAVILSVVGIITNFIILNFGMVVYSCFSLGFSIYVLILNIKR